MFLQIKRGLPGVGKSTNARKAVREQYTTGRVNRDDLRAMLFDGEWSPRREQIVIETEKAIATILRDFKHNCVIDDCNLTQGHVAMWKQHAKDVGFDQVKIDILNADLTTAIRQDAGRQKQVGEAIIMRMALDAGLIDFGDRPIAIVDIDGTLADGTHREVWVSGGRKDWNQYFSLAMYDQPYEVVIRWVQELAKTHIIVIVSGRPDTIQYDTLWWLRLQQVPFNYVFMRRGSDRRPDTMVKQDILKKLPKEQIDIVLDDRPSVIRMWRSHGLKVIPVRGAVEEF